MTPLRIVLKRVGQEPMGVFVMSTSEGNQLQKLQALVGGYLEAIHPPDLRPLAILLNEEGKLKGLPGNFLWGREPIVGDVFVLAADENGDNRSLTPEEEQRAKEWLRRQPSF